MILQQQTNTSKKSLFTKLKEACSNRISSFKKSVQNSLAIVSGVASLNEVFTNETTPSKPLTAIKNNCPNTEKLIDEIMENKSKTPAIKFLQKKIVDKLNVFELDPQVLTDSLLDWRDEFKNSRVSVKENLTTSLYSKSALKEFDTISEQIESAIKQDIELATENQYQNELN